MPLIGTVAAGICSSILADLSNTPELKEIHVGCAARLPQTAGSQVKRIAVHSLKSALQ